MATCRKTPNTMPPAKSRDSSRAASRNLTLPDSLAEVIDPAKLSGSVKFGATVQLVDEDSDEKKTYQIVGEVEANIEAGLLNIRSPLARALIGKNEGESVDVATPGGLRSYEILSVRYL